MVSGLPGGVSRQQELALLHDDGWLRRQRKGKLPVLLRPGPEAPESAFPWYPVSASQKASPIRARETESTSDGWSSMHIQGERN